MKRAMVILVLGLIVAVAGYCSVYLWGTAAPRALLESEQPELSWLKHEFNLSDPELKRISELHDDYIPKCLERCRRIDGLNEQFSQALAVASEMTPELEKLSHERAQVRAACQTEMLKHFFDVSRTMPPAQGKRYLAWVWEHTCLREQPMDHGSYNAPEPAPSAHGH